MKITQLFSFFSFSNFSIPFFNLFLISLNLYFYSIFIFCIHNRILTIFYYPLQFYKHNNFLIISILFRNIFLFYFYLYLKSLYLTLFLIQNSYLFLSYFKHFFLFFFFSSHITYIYLYSLKYIFLNYKHLNYQVSIAVNSIKYAKVLNTSSNQYFQNAQVYQKKIMTQVQKIESTQAKQTIITSIKHKKYNTIDFEKRKELIRRVVKNGQKLKQVSKQLGIKLSTSKFILKIFKRQGRVFKKKTQGTNEETDQQIQELKQTLQQNAKRGISAIQYVYIPVYYPIYIQKQSGGTWTYAPNEPLGITIPPIPPPPKILSVPQMNV